MVGSTRAAAAALQMAASEFGVSIGDYAVVTFTAVGTATVSMIWRLFPAVVRRVGSVRFCRSVDTIA